MKAGFDRIGREVSLEKAKRSCLDKRRYDSRTDARDKAARQFKSNPEHGIQRPYRCTLCGGYHLTKSQTHGGGMLLTRRPQP